MGPEDFSAMIDESHVICADCDGTGGDCENCEGSGKIPMPGPVEFWKDADLA